MNIRPYMHQDRQALISLWQCCDLLSNPANDPAEDIDRCLAGSNATIFVGTDRQERIIASVMTGHDGHRGWIYYLAVDPALQGSGLGQNILKQAEDWLRAANMPKAMLMIRPANLAVLEFYQKAGYQQEDRAIMTLRLDDKGYHASRQQVTVPRQYLEMTNRPAGHGKQQLPSGYVILPASKIDPDYFSYLLNLVGGPWHWTERRWLRQSEFVAKIAPDNVMHLVIYHDGQPVGFAEIDKSIPGESEIVFFGLITAMAGKGLGRAFMEATLDAARDGTTRRVHLTTCGLDHPNALSFYEKCGFTIFKTDEFTHYI